MDRAIVVIAHDIRSTHNVGSLLRTCEGLGVTELICTGYTPYPLDTASDTRLPHLARKLEKQIDKTALGAQQSLPWHYQESVTECMAQLQRDGYTVLALEQSERSTPLPSYQPPAKVALLLGREVDGIDPELVAQCDAVIEIPMYGRKESFNVVQAAAMALYQLRFAPLD